MQPVEPGDFGGQSNLMTAKTLWCWIAALCASAMSLRSQSTTIPPPDKDPFVGHWRANAAKSQPKLNKKEASYERIIKRDGDDLVFASSGGASKATIREFTLRCDGEFHPLPAGPLLLCVYTAPNRVEGETRESGRSQFWIREVSPDGQLMTISGYKDKTHTRLQSILALDRIP